jgi:hypothetical protein
LQPHIRFTGVVWTFLRLLDSGEVEPLDVIEAKIEDGSLFQYLGGKYDVDTSLLPEADQARVLEFFRTMAGVDSRRKFGVEHNGIALVIALASEGIQQAVDSSHEIDLD